MSIISSTSVLKYSSANSWERVLIYAFSYASILNTSFSMFALALISSYSCCVSIARLTESRTPR